MDQNTPCRFCHEPLTVDTRARKNLGHIHRLCVWPEKLSRRQLQREAANLAAGLPAEYAEPRRCNQCSVELTEDNHALAGKHLVCDECYLQWSRDRQASWRRSKGIPEVKKWSIDDSGRECTRCDEYKSWDQFHSQGHNIAHQCKPCWLLTSWENRILRMYGITSDQHNWLLEQQDSQCALCLEFETAVNIHSGEVQKLCVDHFHGCTEGHDSKKGCMQCIRGLLCKSCNVMLGYAEGKPLVEARFSDYLSKRPLV